jgi:hypothetical protein
MNSTYEHIVLGVGGSVLALEQYQLGRDRGASEDHSRIIDRRTGYPIEAFSLDRAAIRDPDYPSDFRFRRAAQAAPGDHEGSTP